MYFQGNKPFNSSLRRIAQDTKHWKISIYLYLYIYIIESQNNICPHLPMQIKIWS